MKKREYASGSESPREDAGSCASVKRGQRKVLSGGADSEG